MDINKTSELLNTLLSQADKKAEKKVYSCFIRLLSSLKSKNLSEHQFEIIDEKLASLDLAVVTGNRKKIYQQKLSEFKEFLKNKFSFTTEKYYTELGMVYGLSLGTGIGVAIGTSIDPVIGTSVGMSMGIGIGMILGMLYGVRKDTEAKKLGRVI